MQTETETSPAPIDHLKPWINAAYGRCGNLTEQYRNIIFTTDGVTRVAQIAGWLVGLVHSGRREEAEKVAEDINSQFSYLNEYGGEAEGMTFGDGSPVQNLRRYMVQLGDDGTFGGFTVGWYSIVTEEQANDTMRPSLLRDRWNGIYETLRWNAAYAPVRHSEKFYYRFAFNGGLLYHGPGGGETFSVTLGNVRFWSIHT